MSKRICIFGDSIVRGHCDHEFGGWAQRLQQHCIHNDSLSVYHLGISGDTTKSLLRRCEAEIIARNPRFVIFSIGLNDAAQRKNKSWVSIDEFTDNLDKLYTITQKHSCETIFTGLTQINEELSVPVSWDDDISYFDNDVAAYDKKIEKFARDKGCYFINMKDLLEKNDLTDGVHPSSIGHKKIFACVKEFLESNIIRKNNE